RSANPERLDERQPATGPHAIAPVGGGKEAATGRMAILAQLILNDRILEKAPLPAQRQRVAIGGCRFAKARRDAPDEVLAQHIFGRLRTTDPGTEIRGCIRSTHNPPAS